MGYIKELEPVEITCLACNNKNSIRMVPAMVLEEALEHIDMLLSWAPSYTKGDAERASEFLEKFITGNNVCMTNDLKSK